MSENYVVTISREFCSMGRSIARRMSELLDIEFYDRDIVEESAKRMNLTVPVVSDAEERASFYSRRFPLGNVTTELQDKIFLAQQDIIRDLVSKGSCIIVGRCADSLFQDHPRHINIYIYTSYENKYNNCINRFGMTPKEAKTNIKEVDEARKAFHKRYARYEADDVHHKDIAIDSSLLGVEGTARFLADLVKYKFLSKE